MLTVTRSDGDSRTAARAKTSEEACAIMEAVEAMFSRSQQKSSTKLAWKTDKKQVPANRAIPKISSGHLEMLTVTRGDAGDRAAASGRVLRGVCATIEVVCDMMSWAQLNQPPAPNELQTMEDRMRVLLRELFTLKEEQPHDDRVEEAMWTETGD